ncbi:MAG: methionyl-tRNA formyltransferase [Synergistes sp.]|nr:methionyl-tRNA formyltransferase [Synergistes sp.]
MPLSVGFMGTGEFAAECLRLISQEIKISWAVTNAPKAAGRGLKLKNTPLFEAAEKCGIETLMTEKLSSDAELTEELKRKNADVIIVIDFGHIVKEPILSMPRLGCINIHPSRLPQFRGAAPVQRTLMAGLKSTAVTIYKLNEGMDTGDILAQHDIEIADNDNAESLYKKAAAAGCAALVHFIRDVPPKEWHFTKQNDAEATFAAKVEKSEGKIDWQNESAEAIVNKIRGIGATPGVFCTFRGKRLRIDEAECTNDTGLSAGEVSIVGGSLHIQCGKGALKLLAVRPEGKKSQRAEDWLRGARVKEQERFE